MSVFLGLTGICDLGCIGECINLERLDLSGNNITNLAPLASLRLLLVLNVSANRISNIGIHYWVFFTVNYLLAHILHYLYTYF